MIIDNDVVKFSHVPIITLNEYQMNNVQINTEKNQLIYIKKKIILVRYKTETIKAWNRLRYPGVVLDKVPDWTEDTEQLSAELSRQATASPVI